MHLRRDGGFSLLELMATMGLFAVLAGLAIPSVLGSLATMKLNGVARSVQNELQAARLTAVTANRPIRVRFNCPTVNQFRMVELIGTPSLPDSRDSGSTRCDPTTYPFPASDRNVLTLPNWDGPVRRLVPNGSFIASQTIEFWPDGTAHVDAGTGNPWPAIGSTGATVTVKYKTKTKSITVNGSGKVNIVQ